MRQLTISVAMATYNGERFIAEQLESFAQQKRLPDELVVSDDGSSDRTLEIVHGFAQRAPFPVRVFVNKKRLGINKNFSRAIELTTGDIVFLSDSDDYWYPQKIRVMAKALEETPEAALAVCNADHVDEQLKPLGMRMWEDVGSFYPSRRFLKALALGRAYRRNLPCGGCQTAFRAKFKPLILPMPPAEGPLCDPYDRFIVRTLICSGAGGAVMLKEPLLAYRRHAGQATHDRRAPLPFRQRLSRRLTARGENPDRLVLFLNMALSEEAAQFCRNSEMRLGVISHCGSRLNMPLSFVRRLPIVGRELATGRYHRFSSGWGSAAKDLLFARRPHDGAPNASTAAGSPGSEAPGLFSRLHRILRPLRAKAGYLRIEGSHRLSARWSRRAGTSKVKRNPELIVSLTTIPERIGKIHLCLDSLLRQSIQPDRIILWLGISDGDRNFPFPPTALPRPLERMQKRGVEIRWCKDIGPFTKIIPTLRAYPEALIVTADDDMFYPRLWLYRLFKAYRQEPQYIHCHRAHLMRYDSAGMPLTYREWEYLAPSVRGPSADLFPTGCGGVLYAPGHLNPEVLNEDSFMALCPRNDDVWLRAMSQLNLVPCKKIGDETIILRRIRFANNRALETFNVIGNGNDPQIEAVRREYGTFMSNTSAALLSSRLGEPAAAGEEVVSLQTKAASAENLP